MFDTGVDRMQAIMHETVWQSYNQQGTFQAYHCIYSHNYAVHVQRDLGSDVISVIA